MPKMCRGFNFPLKKPGEIAGVLPGYSTVYSPGLNFSREPPPIRSTYQSTPPPWHSHNSLFSGEPSSKDRNFFHSNRSHLKKLHFREGPSPAEKFTFSEKPTAHWIEKKKQQPRHQPPAPPPLPPQKYSALPSKPPPHIFSSGTTLSCCAKNVCVCVCMCVCVCVFKYLL